MRRTKRRVGPMHDSETGVVKAVMQYLELDPRVKEVRRQNSGVIVLEYKGKKRIIKTQRNVKGETVKVLDIAGYLRDGRGFELEAKLQLPQKRTIARWLETPPDKLSAEGTHYLAQDARVRFLNSIGAVAGFVTCVADAKLIIDWAFRHEAAA